jgi:hypothetical protein
MISFFFLHSYFALATESFGPGIRKLRGFQHYKKTNRNSQIRGRYLQIFKLAILFELPQKALYIAATEIGDNVQEECWKLNWLDPQGLLLTLE